MRAGYCIENALKIMLRSAHCILVDSTSIPIFRAGASGADMWKIFLYSSLA